MNQNLIVCEHVSVRYEKQPVLADVSFYVREGEYLCIVGENGSGKSTLIKGLLGLIPVQSGTISYPGLAQNEIGYLPQQTPVQKDFPASVFEVALSGCIARKGRRPFFNRVEKQRALDQLERLGMLTLKNRSYRALSGGQQQRVLLARALCATGKLLLLDEPAAGLDPLVTAELYDYIRRLCREEGIAIVMVTHDIPEALRSADQILHLHNDCLFFGDTASYRECPLCHRMTGGDCCDA